MHCACECVYDIASGAVRSAVDLWPISQARTHSHALHNIMCSTLAGSVALQPASQPPTGRAQCRLEHDVSSGWKLFLKRFRVSNKLFHPVVHYALPNTGDRIILCINSLARTARPINALNETPLRVINSARRRMLLTMSRRGRCRCRCRRHCR